MTCHSSAHIIFLIFGNLEFDCVLPCYDIDKSTEQIASLPSEIGQLSNLSTLELGEFHYTKSVGTA